MKKSIILIIMCGLIGSSLSNCGVGTQQGEQPTLTNARLSTNSVTLEDAFIPWALTAIPNAGIVEFAIEMFFDFGINPNHGISEADFLKTMHRLTKKLKAINSKVDQLNSQVNNFRQDDASDKINDILRHIKDNVRILKDYLIAYNNLVENRPIIDADNNLVEAESQPVVEFLGDSPNKAKINSVKKALNLKMLTTITQTLTNMSGSGLLPRLRDLEHRSYLLLVESGSSFDVVQNAEDRNKLLELTEFQIQIALADAFILEHEALVFNDKYGSKWGKILVSEDFDKVTNQSNLENLSSIYIDRGNKVDNFVTNNKITDFSKLLPIGDWQNNCQLHVESWFINANNSPIDGKPSYSGDTLGAYCVYNGNINDINKADILYPATLSVDKDFKITTQRIANTPPYVYAKLEHTSQCKNNTIKMYMNNGLQCSPITTSAARIDDGAGYFSPIRSAYLDFHIFIQPNKFDLINGDRVFYLRESNAIWDGGGNSSSSPTQYYPLLRDNYGNNFYIIRSVNYPYSGNVFEGHYYELRLTLACLDHDQSCKQLPGISKANGYSKIQFTNYDGSIINYTLSGEDTGAYNQVAYLF